MGAPPLASFCGHGVVTQAPGRLDARGAHSLSHLFICFLTSQRPFFPLESVTWETEAGIFLRDTGEDTSSPLSFQSERLEWPRPGQKGLMGRREEGRTRAGII